MESKVCKKCGLEKAIEFFPRNIGMKDGRLNKCKICHTRDTKLYRSLKVKKNTRHYMSMNGITKSDWCRMFDFMKKIGYDPDQDIHTQFCEKHGLQPKKKPPQFTKPYLYSDCE